VNATPSDGHPELETLLAFAAGECPAEKAGPVAAHLESCVSCRLEVKRFQHFEAQGEDPVLDENTQWDRAELELARAWRDEIKPAIGLAPPPVRSFRAPRWAWLVPAAAAATAAFVFLQPTTTSQLDHSGGPESTVVRGAGEVAAPQITLQAPLGESDRSPTEFAWQTELDCTSYTLEIFTADLVLTFFETGIADVSWQATAELAELLEPGTTYLWSVRGYRDLQVVGESENGWFQIMP
jgi:hypothetical protein